MSTEQPAVISEADALARGLKRFFLGTPCRNGHICERAVVTHTCIECRREGARRAAEARAARGELPATKRKEPKPPRELTEEERELVPARIYLARVYRLDWERIRLHVAFPEPAGQDSDGTPLHRRGDLDHLARTIYAAA